MKTGIKIRVLCVKNNPQPSDRPRVVFKGSDAAYEIHQRTMNQVAPKGFHYVTQTANPDTQGFRTSFADLTARASLLKDQAARKVDQPATEEESPDRLVEFSAKGGSLRDAHRALMS